MKLSFALLVCTLVLLALFTVDTEAGSFSKIRKNRRNRRAIVLPAKDEAICIPGSAKFTDKNCDAVARCLNPDLDQQVAGGTLYNIQVDGNKKITGPKTYVDAMAISEKIKQNAKAPTELPVWIDTDLVGGDGKRVADPKPSAKLAIEPCNTWLFGRSVYLGQAAFLGAQALETFNNFRHGTSEAEDYKMIIDTYKFKNIIISTSEVGGMTPDKTDGKTGNELMNMMLCGFMKYKYLTELPANLKAENGKVKWVGRFGGTDAQALQDPQVFTYTFLELVWLLDQLDTTTQPLAGGWKPTELYMMIENKARDNYELAKLTKFENLDAGKGGCVGYKQFMTLWHTFKERLRSPPSAAEVKKFLESTNAAHDDQAVQTALPKYKLRRPVALDQIIAENALADFKSHYDPKMFD